ncbi:DEKNAAC101966 [Brettanomyces naardenensis]|uniref:DEKNAAC101966 n=1 Tax=Brettanomyces naardenensis TaxID=13370 RepID=A0A448YJ94_BRENA|nr:DEKNAAC101966 [Brettanomyces naardenensis]
MEEKYIGLALAISSSFAIGSSFVLTKLGLLKDGSRGESYTYVRNPIWILGTALMAIGEIANFAAYTFAPPILVTPLGALSVIIGAVLAAVFLKEDLGILGKMGCAICLLGSVIIVLHAPNDKEVTTVDEILGYAERPLFALYAISVIVFSILMIYKVAPKYGSKNPMVYISICSGVGSISVCAIKAFGIALKLTFNGNNQFTHVSTYVFIITVVVCIMTQMTFFNKALAQFDTSIVNPLYYVTFTTATLLASFILFRGFNTTSTVDVISLLCGFLIIFSGVYILNISRKSADEQGREDLFSTNKDGLSDLPLNNDISAYQFRKSIEMGRPQFQGDKYHQLNEDGSRRRSDSFELS